MQDKSITSFFEKIEDQRRHNKLHKLIDIIIIAICGVVAGADTYEQIENFGKKRKNWLSTFLELPHGIPSHDTFGRIFERMNPNEFQNSFKRWIESVTERTKGQVVAIDGKTLRRSHDRSNDKKAIHMISAWASSNQVVLGQLKTREKSNEITAIPNLLKLLDISGCIITIDAMGTQKKIAKTIINKDADYILALKENHKTLYGDTVLFFNEMEKMKLEGFHFDEYETVDGDHGRIETRKYVITPDIGWLQDKANWPGLQCLGMVESTRNVQGEVSHDKRYYISSLKCDAKKFGNAVRAHWGIENSVHWVLDIAFREDESRVRKGSAPENFAAIRHIALNLLRNNKTFKGSVKTKRLNAAMDTKYLSDVVFEP
ncbi:ISAs1 family transposase [Desulfobacula sp.]|uniref:ISAs1 family transposase n=1 Tax=Desulfobacula sp. TaxID=2593537 RepID=UPI002605B759|nr:ISAs1 family transposase [Desulfobacula sp.]